MKLYYFYILKTLWDGQGKIKMYYRVFMAKKQLSGKRSTVESAKLVAEKTEKVLVQRKFLIKREQNLYK